MTKKQTYKHTEIGAVPAGWKMKKLGEVCGKITTGKLDANAMVEDGDYRFYTCARDYYFIDKYAFDNEALLISGNGENVGYVHYYKGKFNAYQRTYVLTAFTENIHFIKFYLDSFLAQRIDAEVNLGNTPYIKMGTLTEMQLIIPSSETEQSRIASVLSDTDTLITALDKLIEKKKKIKEGAMVALLTPKKKDEWKEVSLGEACDILNNLRVPVAEARREKGSVPYYGANGIQDYVKGFTHDGEFVLIAEDGANDLANYPVQYTTGRIWVNNHAHILKGKEKEVDTLFLSYLLKKFDFQSALVGGTRAKLNKGVLEKLEIRIPTSIVYQTKIANILSSMDVEISALEQKREKYRQIKSGMMQQLLNGQIRLN